MIVTLDQLYHRLTDDANRRHAETMKGEDDLKAAEAALGTSVGAAVAKINTLAATVAAGAGDPDADIEDSANQLKALAASLDAAVNPPAAGTGTTGTDPAPQPDPAAAGTATL